MQIVTWGFHGESLVTQWSCTKAYLDVTSHKLKTSKHYAHNFFGGTLEVSANDHML